MFVWVELCVLMVGSSRYHAITSCHDHRVAHVQWFISINLDHTLCLQIHHDGGNDSCLSLVPIDEAVDPSLQDIYETTTEPKTRFQELSDLFQEKFNCKPQFYVRAPGRVNLIGEHIDYHEYFMVVNPLMPATPCFPWQSRTTW